MANEPSKNSDSRKSGKIRNQNGRSAGVLKNTFFAVWSLVGVMLIVAALAGFFGEDSFTENLNLTEAEPATEQPPQPQQPPQPTQEDLDCVVAAVGEERFMELEQGAPSSPEENAIIEECFGF